MTETALSGSPAPSVRAGMLDRFYSWTYGLPWRGWWLYPVMVVVLLLLGNGILWATDRLPVGTFDPVITVGTAYGPYSLWAVGYLNNVAARSLVAFWPATGWSVEGQSAWRRAFLTVPAGLLLPCLLIGTLIAFVATMSAPTSVVGSDASSRLIFAAALAPSAIFGYAMTSLAIANTARALRLVDRIHREAQAIDPFDRVPLYAFSRFTVGIGMAFLLAGYYTLAFNGPFQSGNLVGLVVLGVVIAFGAACFVLPLWGIHDRLVGEKEALLAGVENRVTKLAGELYRRIDAADYDGTKTINEAIAAAGSVRERINRLPTWPWPPQLFRGFLSALLLPVIVYLLSRLIAGQIGA